MEGLKKLRLWFKKYKNSLLFGVFLLIFTIILKVNNGQIDKQITNLFYNSSLPLEERFYYQDAQPWVFLNDYNKIFQYILLGTILPMIAYGLLCYKKKSFFLRYGLYGFVSAVLSVVIFVNLIFKDFYGRPRPRQTNLWPISGNTEIFNFYSVWEPAFLKDPSLIDVGKSFPSGHVSLLAIFIIYYFIFKSPDLWSRLISNKQSGNKKKLFKLFAGLKWFGLLASVILGILTGIGRIAVGAHYTSDVLWAFGMVYILNVIVYYWIFTIPKFENQLSNELDKENY